MEKGELHFDDEQSARIIKRALEIQRNEGAERPDHDGLSLNDLEAIGRESGIDPDIIRRAARELAVDASPAPGNFVTGFVGSPLRNIIVSSFPVETEKETLEEMLATLSAIASDSGNGSVVGRTLTWNSDALAAMRSGRMLHLIVRALDTGTEVRLESDLGGTAGGLFGGLMGGIGLGAGLGVGLGVGLGALASPLFAVLVPVGTLSAAYLLARGIFAIVSRARRKRDQTIVDRIRALIGA